MNLPDHLAHTVTRIITAYTSPREGRTAELHALIDGLSHNDAGLVSAYLRGIGDTYIAEYLDNRRFPIFRPTHRITVYAPDGNTYCPVMLYPDGAAPSHREWADATKDPEWRCVDGVWLCRGKALPDGATSVGVCPVERDDP